MFDDSDFYSQLLRDLIDNAGIMEAGTSSAATDALHTRKRKRNVDVRASKGRRLRYDVMEKVQNFMPRIPKTAWDEAQTERPFSRLASVTGAPSNASAAKETIPPQDVADLSAHGDGFRLLG